MYWVFLRISQSDSLDFGATLSSDWRTTANNGNRRLEDRFIKIQSATLGHTQVCAIGKPRLEPTERRLSAASLSFEFANAKIRKLVKIVFD